MLSAWRGRCWQASVPPNLGFCPIQLLLGPPEQRNFAVRQCHRGLAKVGTTTEPCQRDDGHAILPTSLLLDAPWAPPKR